MAVVGGGDTAIDAARTALRLGASEVHLVYRRTREEMPALAEEVDAAEAEGVRLHLLANPSTLLGNGRVESMRCVRQVLGEFDDSGRRKPVPAPGSEFDIDVEVVIPAIGQVPDVSALAPAADGQARAVAVDGTMMTSLPGVFAAGDAVTGPATVVEAVGQGNRVALFVDAYLQGKEPAPDEVWSDYRVLDLTYEMEAYAAVPRAKAGELPPEARARSFLEVEQALSEEAARQEARRCLRCDLERRDGE